MVFAKIGDSKIHVHYRTRHETPFFSTKLLITNLGMTKSFLVEILTVHSAKKSKFLVESCVSSVLGVYKNLDFVGVHDIQFRLFE